MPTEFRRIIFSNAELREALVGYRGDEQVTLPQGHIRGVRFSSDAQDRLVVATYDPLGDKLVENDLQAALVAAALLRYCIARRIPIQRSAQKSLVLAGENVALDLRSAAKGTDGKPA
jgi:hypothetical protein